MREVRTCFNHSPSASVRGWTDTSNRDSPAYYHDSQITKEFRPNQGSGGGSTPHSESFRSPLISPGHEGVPPPTKDSIDINVADPGTTKSPYHTISGRSHQGVSPTSLCEKPGRPLFQCALCPEREPYSQKQGLLRHSREKHQPGFECSHPGCDYKWTRSRRSEYRKHLKKKHKLEDDNIDEILVMARRLYHRRGSVIESDLPPYFSLPPVKRDRQSLAGPQQRPQMLPPLAVGNDANHASPPLIPSVAYNPRLGDAEPEIATTEHEDSSGLEHLAATHAPSRLLSEEGFARLMGHLRIHGRIRFPSVYPGALTTADVPPNLGMLHIPALPSPVGGYLSSPVS